jgi:hypothetical protein
MEKDKGNRRCLLDLPLKNIDELVPFLMPMSLRRPGAGVKRCEVHADAHGGRPYSDIDLGERQEGARFVFTRNNGEPYP